MTAQLASTSTAEVETRGGSSGLDVQSACQIDELQVPVRDPISKARWKKKEGQKDGSVDNMISALLQGRLLAHPCLPEPK